MDLIAQLSSTLGVDPAQAQALAGTVLGGVKSQVADELGEDAAGQLDAQVPELDGWQQQAEAVAGSAGGGLLGGLGGDLLGAVAGAEAKQAAQVAAMISNLGLDASKAALIAPMALAFLKDRMSEEWIDRALQVAPLLTGGAAESNPAADAMGALGSLFGGS